MTPASHSQSDQPQRGTGTKTPPRRPAPTAVGPAAPFDQFRNVHDLKNIHPRVQGVDHYATFRPVSNRRVGNPARLPQTPHSLRCGDVRGRALQRRIFFHSWTSQLTAMYFRCAILRPAIDNCPHRPPEPVSHAGAVLLLVTAGEERTDPGTVGRRRSVTQAPDQARSRHFARPCHNSRPRRRLPGRPRPIPGAHPEVNTSSSSLI